jgi:adenylate cyclase
MGDNPAWIDFHGPPGTIKALSFSDVLRGRVPAKAFQNKVVVVGPAAPSLQDVHPTSTTGHGLMSGAELQASAVSTALRDFPLQDAPGALDVFFIVLLGLVAPAASWKLGAGRAMLVALGAAAVFLLIAQLAFSAGMVLAVATPLLALALGAVGAVMANYLLATIQREQTRAMFSRFVPDAVVDQMLSGSGRPALPEAVRLECTILFCDLRGFTTFAEDLPPARVVELLNRYLGSMTEAVLDNHGTLAAYMGDGLMAIFGAPLARSEHADDAMRAVRDMLERMEEFNRWMNQQNLGPGFDIGIGLNSGPVMAGNVGSERRLEYTAIGDTVNTASRLESLTKGTPYALFLSESTYRLVEQERADLEFAGEFDVRGRRSRVSLWGLRRPDWGRVAPPTGERRAAPDQPRGSSNDPA